MGSPEADDSVFDAEWGELSAVLKAVGRPPAIDRRSANPMPAAPESSACVVHLGLTEGRWAMPITGTQVFEPGAVIWALSADWLSRSGDDLYCRRGVWADRSGQLFLDDFSPPRRVTYFANFLTPATTYGKSAAGQALEAGIACPQSSCTEILTFTGCKVTTRVLARSAGVRVPPSLALISLAKSDLLVRNSCPDVTVVEAGQLFEGLRLGAVDARVSLERIIDSYLRRWPNWVDRVVVKPSGVMHMGGARVLGWCPGMIFRPSSTR